MYLFKDITYLNPDMKLQEHVDILIDGDRFAKVAPTGTQEYPGATVIDGQNKLLTPAFYNAHCHVPMTLLRGLGENLTLLDWLEQKIFPYEALMTPDDAYHGTRLGVAELLASGVAAISDMYMFLPGVLRAMGETKFKANICNPLAGMDWTSFQESKGFEETPYLIEYARNDATGKVIADAGVHGEYTSRPEAVKTLIQYALDNNLAIHCHLSESKTEHEGSIERHGKTPLRYFYDLGMFEAKRVQFAHAIWLSDDDYELLRSLVNQGKMISLVHNPSSNMKLASGFAPLKKWAAAGVNICLGTDGAASNNNLNMMEEMHLAAMLQKVASGDPTFLTPEEVWYMATRAGALAMGRTDCGEIKEGYKADCILFDVDKPHLYPKNDLLSHLVYSAQASDIESTFVDGERLYHQGEYATIDLADVKDNVERIRREKAAQLNL